MGLVSSSVALNLDFHIGGGGGGRLAREKITHDACKAKLFFFFFFLGEGGGGGGGGGSHQHKQLVQVRVSIWDRGNGHLVDQVA